jgi:hypothetical protein
VALWIVLLITNGPLFALEAVWLPLIALGVGAWATMRRLRFSRSGIRVILGPWSREVDLSQSERIRWKRGFGPLSQGSGFGLWAGRGRMAVGPRVAAGHPMRPHVLYPSAANLARKTHKPGLNLALPILDPWGKHQSNSTGRRLQRAPAHHSQTKSRL